MIKAKSFQTTHIFSKLKHNLCSHTLKKKNCRVEAVVSYWLITQDTGSREYKSMARYTEK
jgi:hypothetical protein